MFSAGGTGGSRLIKVNLMLEYQPLSVCEAQARLSVVSAIEIVGYAAVVLLVRWVPRWSWFKLDESKTEWLRDCLRFANFFGRISLALLFITLIISVLWSWGVSFPEWVIRVVFGINTICFALGMIRSGGPSRSFFGQLVPLQLSGILVLEQQKAMLTQVQFTTWVFVFAAFSMVVWLVAVLSQKRVVQCWNWSEISSDHSLERFNVFAATVLFVLSVCVTVMAYWLPLQPWFIAFFSRRRCS